MDYCCERFRKEAKGHDDQYGIWWDGDCWSARCEGLDVFGAMTFCPFCGAELSQPTPAQPTEQP